jgi:hypothetical protein
MPSLRTVASQIVNLEIFGGFFPNLAHDLTCFSKLQKLKLSCVEEYFDDQALQNLPTTLRYLSSHYRMYDFSDVGLQSVASRCPSLTNLKIGSTRFELSSLGRVYCCEKVTGKSLLSFKNMKNLELTYLDNVLQTDFVQLPSLNPNLEHLSLAKKPGFSTEEIMKIVTWKTLVSLSLDHSGVIAECLLFSLKNNPNIESIQMCGKSLIIFHILKTAKEFHMFQSLHNWVLYARN